jgi:hypothetical protein
MLTLKANISMVVGPYLYLLLTVEFVIVIHTNVAYAVGPSVNALRVQLIFPSKPNFCNLFEFSATKFTQNSIYFTP